MIYAIFALDENNGMGRNELTEGDTSHLPWPPNMRDFKRFKKLTKNNTIIMGRKTWNCLPMKPLANRINVVVSATMEDDGSDDMPDYFIEDINNIDGALNFHEMNAKVFIIGGARLLTATWHLINHVYLTRIPGTYNCDVFFTPDFSEFKKIKSESNNECEFEEWER